MNKINEKMVHMTYTMFLSVFEVNLYIKLYIFFDICHLPMDKGEMLEANKNLKKNCFHTLTDHVTLHLL